MYNHDAFVWEFEWKNHGRVSNENKRKFDVVERKNLSQISRDELLIAVDTRNNPMTKEQKMK